MFDARKPVYTETILEYTLSADGMGDAVANATDQLIIELASQGTKLVATVGSGLLVIASALIGLAIYHINSTRATLQLRAKQVALSQENNEIKKALSPKSTGSM